jgi:Tfp pilus assembly protein PilF
MKRKALLVVGMFLAFGTTGPTVCAAQCAKDGSTKSRSQSGPLADQMAQTVELLDAYRGDSATLSAARTTLEEIIKSDPQYVPAYREMARYFIMSGHISYLNFQPGSLEAAEKCLKIALDIDPRYAEAYVPEGHLYRLMKRSGDAKAALTAADQLGASDPWLQNNWADILIDEGRFDEAAQRYRRVIDSGTSNKKAMISAFEGLTSYYTRTGRPDEVDSLYKKQIAYEPDRAWTYGNYAQFLLCDRDDFDAAISRSRQALKLMDYGIGRTTLASSLYRKWADLTSRGEILEAARYLSEAKAFSSAPAEQIVRSLCGGTAALTAVRNAVSRAGVRN